MKLQNNGREYAFWPISGAPDGATFEISFDDGETWEDLETVEGGARALLAGPDADPGSAIVLPLGRNKALIRLVDSPEIVVRGGGYVIVD